MAIKNRRGFLALAEEEIGRVARYGGDVAVIAIDLDHFKNINDTHGHAVGDEVLRTVVSRCHLQLRAQDVFGRLGGEEFAIIAPQTSIESAAQLAERLREVVAQSPVSTATGDIDVTASFGVCMVDPSNPSIDRVLECADKALYQAKNLGRDRVEVIDTREKVSEHESESLPPVWPPQKAPKLVGSA